MSRQHECYKPGLESSRVVVAVADPVITLNTIRSAAIAAVLAAVGPIAIWLQPLIRDS